MFSFVQSNEYNKKKSVILTDTFKAYQKETNDMNYI